MWWAGDPWLRDVRCIHEGPLFSVFRATLAGRDVAIKCRATRPRWNTSLASSWTRENMTNVFHTVQVGWTEVEPEPGERYIEALLRAEHAVIKHAAVDWNHPGAQLARWIAGDVLIDAQSEATGSGGNALGGVDESQASPLCMVMPWCDGESFASLTRAEQRRCFPLMLRALWAALTACPHGDLAADSLWLHRTHGFFRLFDPGVRVSGPSHPGYLNFTSELFTTNAANYCLVRPEHGPARPQIPAPGGGLARVVASHASQFDHHMLARKLAQSPVRAPAAADIVACGALYFEVLAGVPLWRVLGIAEPKWTGHWGTRSTRPAALPADFEGMVIGNVVRTLNATDATPAEILLCQRLITLDVTGETVERAADVSRSLT